MSARRRVVYLSLGAPHLEYQGVVAALRDRGVDAELVHLDQADDVNWGGVDLVNVRMCRGYHARPDFLYRLECLHDRLSRTPGRTALMANPIELIREAVDKGVYLRRLAEAGVDLVPTRWVPRGSEFGVEEVMEGTGWNDVVIKPTVSAGSWRTVRVSRSGVSSSSSHFVLDDGVRSCEEEVRRLSATHDLCVQQFLPAILEEGELSFVFLGGVLSHAVHKTVGNRGGWWAHERLGGINHPLTPSSQDTTWAHTVYAALEDRYGPLTFGRVDGIRGPDGVLLLLECELAIPRLLLPEGRAFDRYAAVIAGSSDQTPAALDR